MKLGSARDMYESTQSTVYADKDQRYIMVGKRVSCDLKSLAANSNLNIAYVLTLVYRSGGFPNEF